MYDVQKKYAILLQECELLSRYVTKLELSETCQVTVQRTQLKNKQLTKTNWSIVGKRYDDDLHAFQDENNC